ncbi:dihydroxy-acid dehydratase [Thermopolyspora flexuosa]|uniref:Dihydroxyacid dehydratase n=1 Tax=Thermopolyspora flexuosa TaxID=103836 RepID=A0A543IU18_9ACTN|nr:dihydroxy-acid dehydratase [Thermopolyspora flexuosa]TQM74066.1 dihydroxyacid dehydratase [Thermopolyspora flexuosa]GGM94185.1 dihydroxy-acid dehydratase [Thermopolyspora flexuosa]
MRPLRSNFEPGTTRWAMRRAQWTALGLTPEDMEKPKIAIVNTSSDLASCFAHLDEIVGPLKQAIREAGGVGFEIRTAAPSDAITSAGAAGQYILPSRDLIAADIEVAAEGALLDGMICLSSCDKTTPAHLMAAARLNIPTIIVACGYQPSGVYRGEHVDFEDVFLYAGHVATGKMTVEELAEMSACAITGPGVCAGMGTANSMHITAEVLGMALPGSTPVLARSEKMWRTVKEAGRRIVELVAEDVRPRDILTPGAFRNAVTAVLAISGSVNTLKHLQAVAVEAGCDVDVYALFEELAPQVPLLAGVKPNGPRRIDEFEAAGGALALMHRLAPMLDLDRPTVSGRTVREIVSSVTPPESDVIRPLDDPLARHPGIVVIRGSLAPDGAVVKRTVADEAPRRFRGPAKVFRSREEGIAAIRNGEVEPGQVLVLTGLGLRGSPGMGLTSAFVFALDGAGLGPEVAVVTDGQMSGLVNKGLVVAEVSPEGAVGGPLGLVRDGDMISIDVDARTIDLEVDEDELARRRAAMPETPAPPGCGWLSVYARTVRPLTEGATLGG